MFVLFLLRFISMIVLLAGAVAHFAFFVDGFMLFPIFKLVDFHPNAFFFFFCLFSFFLFPPLISNGESQGH